MSGKGEKKPNENLRGRQRKAQMSVFQQAAVQTRRWAFLGDGGSAHACDVGPQRSHQLMTDWSPRA